MGDRYLRSVSARCGDCAGEWTFHNPDLALYRDWVKAHLRSHGKSETEAERQSNMLWDRMRLQLLFDESTVEAAAALCTCETDGACQVCRSEHWRFTG